MQEVKSVCECSCACFCAGLQAGLPVYSYLIQGCTTQDKAFLLVMEYLSGGSLFDALHRDDDCIFRWTHGKNATAGLGRRIALQLADALAYLHTNHLLHLDIKSANVLIATDTETIKLADFGLSQVKDQHSVSGESGTRGTNGWMPSEVGTPTCMNVTYTIHIYVHAFTCWQGAVVNCNSKRLQWHARTWTGDHHHPLMQEDDTAHEHV